MSLWTGRSISCRVPAAVLYDKVALRTIWSLLICIFCTKANFHWPLTRLLSWTSTTSPFWRFLDLVCHFGWMTRLGKTSRLQRTQKAFTMLCVKSNLYLKLDRFSKGPWGITADDLPRRRSLGHRYDPSSGVDGTLPIGRWLTIWPTSNITVWNSLKVSTFSPIAAFRALLVVFIKASVAPLYQGASTGGNDHSIFMSAPNDLIFSQSILLITFFSSFEAPTSIVALSL